MSTAPRSPQPGPTILGPAPTVLSATRPGTPAPAPQALLLDFGGVVISTTSRVTWARELAEIVVERARAVGAVLEAAEVEDSLRVGRAALSLWKNAASRRLAPRELEPREIVEDFLLADLQATVRSALSLDAQELLAAMAPLVAEHHLRPGIAELLTECAARGIRLGIVSNAHSGRAHRTILENLGLADAFGVQIYSDEVGIRKPHPDMIRLATEALGVTPQGAWYVGDTLDRDVVAGRRAGVGAVVITRDRRTDHPPFRVTDTPDLVLDTPEGLLAPLREALDGAGGPASADDRPAPAPQPAPQSARQPDPAAARRPALLLDHGGVITLSTPNPQRFTEVAARILALSRRIGSPIDLATAERAAAEGWDRHRTRKRARDASADPAHRHEEIDPAMLWGDLVGADLPAPLRAALRLEAPQLSLALHRNKNLPAPRPGALELIRWCQEQGIVVGIVSNTISGRGVREILARYGLTAMIGPSAYSDEVGVRKPGGAIFEAALAGLSTDRADVVYVGDKALNDGRGGREAGIGTICLLRGGKDSEELLEAALAGGDADHVLDSPAQVIDVLSALLPAGAR
ncbi:MAG: HAD-IA family hydrolase [Brachybacterium sp.]